MSDDDLKERLRANHLDECYDAIDRIEELEAQLAKATGNLNLIANHQASNPHEDTECQAYARVALAEIKGETP